MSSNLRAETLKANEIAEIFQSRAGKLTQRVHCRCKNGFHQKLAPHQADDITLQHVRFKSIGKKQRDFRRTGG